ncbi:MAG TPA: hypothetical protein VGG12_02835 [Methylovirgula sp.]
MKHVLLTTLAGAAGIIATTAFAQAAAPSCAAPNAAFIEAQEGAARAGGIAVQLAGDQAERFLYYLNDKTGRNTDTWGDGVIIAHYPMLGYDSVAIVDDGCVNEANMIQLDPQTSAMAYQASQDPNF